MTVMAVDLLVVGDANPEVVLSGMPRGMPYGQRAQLVATAGLSLGGSGAITACGAARLGLRTAFVGRVGDDEAGRFALGAMAARGVDVSGCVVDPRLATSMTVVLVDGGDRSTLTAPGCVTNLSIVDIDVDLAKAVRHVHVSSYFLQPHLAPDLPAWFAAIRRRGGSTSLDTKDDPSGAWDGGVASAIAETDILLSDETNALALARRTDGDVIAACRQLAMTSRLPVVTRGERGAVAWWKGRAVTAPTWPVTSVDTVGAGDSFNAGFLAGWLGGRGMPGSLRVAALCGSLSTRAVGPTAAQASRSDVAAAFGPRPAAEWAVASQVA